MAAQSTDYSLWDENLPRLRALEVLEGKNRRAHCFQRFVALFLYNNCLAYSPTSDQIFASFTTFMAVWVLYTIHKLAWHWGY